MGNRVAKLLQYSCRTPSCAKRNYSPAGRTDHPPAKITPRHGITKSPSRSNHEPGGSGESSNSSRELSEQL